MNVEKLKKMNVEKLKKMQEHVRIGGKGTPRRKKKIVRSTQATDDKKLLSKLKKLRVYTLPNVEVVNMIKDDGTVIHFKKPKAQMSKASKIFAITGHGENKQITEMVPDILSELGPEGLNHLKRLASSVANSGVFYKNLDADGDDKVPDSVENLDEASKGEVAGGKLVADEDDEVSEGEVAGGKLVADEDDEVSDLVENFDAASIGEVAKKSKNDKPKEKIE